MTSLDELYGTYLRPLNLEWRLGGASRRRVILASFLPALVIVAELVRTIMFYSFSPAELIGRGISSEPWHHIYVAVNNLRVLSAVAVAVLFCSGLGRWSRAEASWMFLVGTLLAIIAIVLGFLAILVLTAIDDPDVILDLRLQFLWPDVSQTFGFLAIGFFFVAYRGLTEVTSRPAHPPVG